MIPPSSLPELLREAHNANLLDLFTASWGKLLAYDSSTKRARIELGVRRPITNEEGELTSEDLPNCIEVPVMFLGGAGVRISYPLAVGDLMLVLFTQFDNSQFLSTGEVANPMTARTHSLSNAVAFPCGSLDTDSSTQEAEEAVIIRGPEVRLGSKYLAAEVDNVALADTLTKHLTSLGAWLDAHSHPSHGSPPTTAPSPAVPTDIASPTVKAEKP